jgi:hypothetical protein
MVLLLCKLKLETIFVSFCDNFHLETQSCLLLFQIAPKAAKNSQNEFLFIVNNIERPKKANSSEEEYVQLVSISRCTGQPVR